MRKTKAVFFILFFVFFKSTYAQDNGLIQQKSIDSLKKHPDLWYVDKIPPPVKYTVDSTKQKSEVLKTQEIPEPLDFNFEILFEILKYLFLFAVVAGVLYFILKGDFSFNFMRKRNDNVDEIISESTKIETEEQLQAIGFEGQIAAAENNQNYRLAIRLYYLWLIKIMVEKGYIKFHIDKTNQDYCNELQGKPPYSEFVNCTNYYNYVWFGEFEIDETLYRKIANRFKTLIAHTL